MELEEHLQLLAKQANSKNSSIVSADEADRWPEDRLEKLLKMGVLIPTSKSESVCCPGCEENCFVEPTFITLPDGKSAIQVLCRQEGMLVDIDPESLNRWELNNDKLPKPVKENQNAKYSRKSQKFNEKTLIISALLEHHQYGMDTEFNFEPLSQQQLSVKLGWKQYKLSRALDRSFSKDFWTTYKQARKADTLKGFLRNLDDESTDVDAIHYRPQHPTEKEEKKADRYQ